MEAGEESPSLLAKAVIKPRAGGRESGGTGEEEEAIKGAIKGAGVTTVNLLHSSLLL